MFSSHFTSIIDHSLHRAFTKMYHSDISTYGDPALTANRVMDPTKLPEWVVKIDGFAQK